MEKTPILIDDLLKIAEKLPNPDTFFGDTIVLAYGDSVLSTIKETPEVRKNLIFVKKKVVKLGKETAYWVCFSFIAFRKEEKKANKKPKPTVGALKVRK